MFFWGMLASLGALALESLLMLLATSASLAETSSPADWFMPVAVVIEELFSLILMGGLFQNSPNKKNIFARALFFGAGFSLPEILLNYSNFSTLSPTIILSYAGLFLIHTATAGVLGIYFSKRETFSPSILFFLPLAIAIHLAFNFSVLFNLDIWFSLTLPVCVILVGFLASKMHPLRVSLPIQKN